MADVKKEQEFDLKLAIECAKSYSISCGIGCTVSDTAGRVLFVTEGGCAQCRVCEAAGLDGDNCIRSQQYGMTEAERFGGKYIYFCPMGLTCFVSPIMGKDKSSAKITVGPFLMSDREDYVEFDLKERLKLDDARMAKVLTLTDKLPSIPVGRVNSLSVLLFMSVSFMNNVSAANHMLELQDSEAIQGQITEYIMELKAVEKPPEYPLEMEKALLFCIADSDKQAAQSLLNELLGHILFSSGGDFGQIKSRIYELLALISRAATDAGAPVDETFRMNHSFYKKAALTSNIDELCFLLAELLNKYIDSLFLYSEVKNADVINKAVHYMRRNCTEKIVLDDIAKAVYLSPAYFSKIFKQETGVTLNAYLNRLRIEKSKQMLSRPELQLADIASLSGFEDQSYFTKVFKRITGMSPNQYRKSCGRRSPANNY